MNLKGKMMDSEKKVLQVYRAINQVQAELAECGITKDRRNSSQGYNFRGIDDVYNVLSPILAKCGLCILPRMIARQCEEVPTKSGGSMRYVTVEAEFDFVSVEDGSSHTCRTFGEAMDSADKATNKAMSAAYKYAAFQAFAIPTEGDNDADGHTPDPAPRYAPQPQRPAAPSRPAAGPAKLPEVGNWRDVPIHVGKKYVGQTLGSVPESVQQWFLTEWKKDKRVGEFADNDRLIAALEAMARENGGAA
jgi:hypothetical protein